MTPEFLYDFGSPNAYLAWRVLPEIEERTGVHFARVPVLLGGIFKETGNVSPFQRFGPVKGRMEYEMREMSRFLAKHQITNFQMNPHFPQNSLTMMRAAIAAEEAGNLKAYNAACFKGMWEEGLKMDDAEVFKARLDQDGLPGAMLLAKASEAETKAKLVENTNRAVERGVFGIPSFFVGEELYFGKDRLGDVELDILRSKG
ncbi:2-hydroxychromene-2-carboxylate isomerase [Parvularcula sp. ZS-1/3]|uniref:2-hydroxychromene-2-carboxylate isomerase n=1 Tax=Parvularcula mediterranea TaxID=2732508 RepID=A0A7Y3RJA2_9PROT|nr:2-hydroxychromene-2-carboxylate isomerase [Parvularcula mediterranea]NNU15061.1 2-hydroxychromene-2-carboxylate isomerase [Parvularcula mediterranea]